MGFQPHLGALAVKTGLSIGCKGNGGQYFQSLSMVCPTRCREFLWSGEALRIKLGHIRQPFHSYRVVPARFISNGLFANQPRVKHCIAPQCEVGRMNPHVGTVQAASSRAWYWWCELEWAYLWIEGQRHGPDYLCRLHWNQAAMSSIQGADI